MNPGIYPDLSNEDYHSGPGVSKSGLTKFKKSPAHYVQYMKERDEPKTPQKLDDLRFGCMAHLAVLEPEKFEDAPVFEGSRRSGNAWKAFHAEHGRDYLLRKEVQIIKDMAEAVHDNPIAYKLLNTPGVVEESCFWYDETSGELCRTRPDRRKNNGTWIDYKTCKDASPRGFSKAIADYGYHIQAAMALDGYKANKIELSHFFFVAQEKEKPYNVEVYRLADEAIRIGQLEYQELLLQFSDCKIANNWHGYTDGNLNNIDLPDWYYKQNS